MNWNYSSTNGIATNANELIGGIVDYNIEGWFAIPNNDDVEMREGFASKQEAIDYLESMGKEWKIKMEGRLLLMIASKLRVENAKSLSDIELSRCLGGCVAPTKLMKFARQFINEGQLTEVMLKEGFDKC